MRTKPQTERLSSFRTWRRLDLSGTRYGMLTAVAYAGSRRIGTSKTMQVIWECRCDCGQTTYVAANGLRRGKARSCGCSQQDFLRRSATKHGYCGTKEYRAYQQAKGRCRQTTNPKYRVYGARGIEFRFPDFDAFLKELGLAPSPSHSVDRIDTNGHYEPGNVRWATPLVQTLNKRNAKIITHNGRSLRVYEWSKITGVSIGALRRRLGSLGWSVERALSTPPMNKTPKR